MNALHWRGLTAALALSAVLLGSTGCGSSSSSKNDVSDGDETPTPTLTGKAADDGYLAGATVCLDVNLSGSCAGQPTDAVTTTDSQGTYEFFRADADQYAVIVETQNATMVTSLAKAGYEFLPGSAADQSGEARLKVLMAPAGKGEFVSPMTTVVQNRFLENQLQTLDQVETALQVDMGISASMFEDYVAATDDEQQVTQLAARILARIAANVEAEIRSDFSDALNDNPTLGVAIGPLVASIVQERQNDIAQRSRTIKDSTDQEQEIAEAAEQIQVQIPNIDLALLEERALSIAEQRNLVAQQGTVLEILKDVRLGNIAYDDWDLKAGKHELLFDLSYITRDAEGNWLTMRGSRATDDQGFRISDGMNSFFPDPDDSIAFDMARQTPLEANEDGTYTFSIEGEVTVTSVKILELAGTTAPVIRYINDIQDTLDDLHPETLARLKDGDEFKTVTFEAGDKAYYMAQTRAADHIDEYTADDKGEIGGFDNREDAQAFAKANECTDASAKDCYDTTAQRYRDSANSFAYSIRQLENDKFYILQDYRNTNFYVFFLVGGEMELTGDESCSEKLDKVCPREYLPYELVMNGYKLNESAWKRVVNVMKGD
ncbi:hypothetical protein [Desulfurispira natronophila]|uniref:Carboxypeptidase regulatory-like domain-containing protein n=1 Tax=Desulfurispira natronophila TaxID=682562 RepID=A0A7W7Y680_9BACT|nr:hypothetical protein [Desulfurispira natronophila]MBB5022856.1 hypothetical protein [Desulfurispira natronophila]